MLVQEVAIHDNQMVTMVTTKIAGDIEVIYDVFTKEGTIFFEEIEVECKITARVLASLQKLNEQSNLLDKVKTLQQIERSNKVLI